MSAAIGSVIAVNGGPGASALMTFEVRLLVHAFGTKRYQERTYTVSGFSSYEALREARQISGRDGFVVDEVLVCEILPCAADSEPGMSQVADWLLTDIARWRYYVALRQYGEAEFYRGECQRWGAYLIAEAVRGPIVLRVRL